MPAATVPAVLVRWIAVLGLLLTTGCGIVLDDEIGVPVTTSTVPGGLGAPGAGTGSGLDGPGATLPGGAEAPEGSSTSTSGPPALRFTWCEPLGAAVSLAQGLGTGDDLGAAQAAIGQLVAVTAEIVADPDAPADLVAVADGLRAPLGELGDVADDADGTDALTDPLEDFRRDHGEDFDRLVSSATSACLGTP